MPFTAKDILSAASITLLDQENTRWPLSELLGYINQAIAALVAVKPNANSETVTLYLQAGTLQTLPDNCTLLSRVTRNMVTGHDEPGGPVGGAAIRQVAGRDLMDAFFPGWQSDATLFAGQVKHVIHDMADRRTFYVIPGNDGTGKIEAVVGVFPTDLPVPGTPDDIEQYATITVPLPDVFRTAVLDYVLYRAFSKDGAVPASEARAAKHSGAFQAMLVAITSAETGMSAATKAAGG